MNQFSEKWLFPKSDSDSVMASVVVANAEFLLEKDILMGVALNLPANEVCIENELSSIGCTVDNGYVVVGINSEETMIAGSNLENIDVIKLNEFTAELQDTDELLLTKFRACVQYENTADVNEMADILDNLDDYTFFEDVKDTIQLGIVKAEESGVPKNAIRYLNDYYGSDSMERSKGKFTDNGYVEKKALQPELYTVSSYNQTAIEFSHIKVFEEEKFVFEFFESGFPKDVEAIKNDLEYKNYIDSLEPNTVVDVDVEVYIYGKGTETVPASEEQIAEITKKYKADDGWLCDNAGYDDSYEFTFETKAENTMSMGEMT